MIGRLVNEWKFSGEISIVPEELRSSITASQRVDGGAKKEMESLSNIKVIKDCLTFYWNGDDSLLEGQQ